MDSHLYRLLTFQDANTTIVIIGTTLLGIACGAIGCFTVLQKRALVSDSMAHASLPGICTAYFIFGEKTFTGFLLGALVFGLLSALFISLVTRYSRIKEDSAIAISIGMFFGLGLVLSRIIQSQPGGDKTGLDTFIFGKAASMVYSDTVFIAATSLLVLLTIGLFIKELSLLCFNPAFGRVLGWPILLFDYLLIALIAIVTVVGLPAVGAILIVSLLIIPAMTARFWTHSLWKMVVLAGLCGGFAGFMGTALSATLPVPRGSFGGGWPTGPLITLVASSLFFLSLIFSPSRGILSIFLLRLRREDYVR